MRSTESLKITETENNAQNQKYHSKWHEYVQQMLWEVNIHSRTERWDADSQGNVGKRHFSRRGMTFVCSTLFTHKEKQKKH